MTISRRQMHPWLSFCGFLLLIHSTLTPAAATAADWNHRNLDLSDHLGDLPEEHDWTPISPIAPVLSPSSSPTVGPTSSPSLSPTLSPIRTTILNAFVISGQGNLLNNHAVKEKVENAYSLLIQDVLYNMSNNNDDNNNRQRHQRLLLLAPQRRLALTGITPGSVQIYNLVPTECGSTTNNAACYIFYGSFEGIFPGDTSNLPFAESAVTQAIQGQNFQKFLDAVGPYLPLVYVGIPPSLDPLSPQELTDQPTLSPTLSPTTHSPTKPPPTPSPQKSSTEGGSGEGNNGQDSEGLKKDQDRGSEKDMGDTADGGSGSSITLVAVVGAVAVGIASVLFLGSRRHLKRRAETGAFPDFEKELAASQDCDDEESSSSSTRSNVHDDEGGNDNVSDSSSDMDVGQASIPDNRANNGAFNQVLTSANNTSFLQFTPSRIDEVDEKNIVEV